MSTNQIILVDNATLSGVERLLGLSKIINMNGVENDILCLEKLLTAILFSDRLICIDDYKEEFRSTRMRSFSFIDFERINTDEYNDISLESSEFAKGMMFSFDGAKPAGDVVCFFESLRINPQLRWSVFGSSEYLTLSLLVNDTRNTDYEAAIDSVLRHDNSIAGAIKSEFASAENVTLKNHPEIAEIKDLVQAFRNSNSRYSGTDGRNLLSRCIFGYGWAAERTFFYNTIAARRNADAFLAPLRDAFSESCCRLESRSQVNSLIEQLKSKSQATLERIVEPSGRARFAVKLPFFTAYLISKSENAAQCIDLALDLRKNSDFRDCRGIINNLAHLGSQDRYAEVNKILNLLEQASEALMKKYSVSTANGPQASISLGISALGVPSISVGTSLKLDRVFAAYRNRPFSRLFRNISQDMLNVERLGGLYEKLCSSMVKHKDANYPKVSTAPKFMEEKDGGYSRPAKL